VAKQSGVDPKVQHRRVHIAMLSGLARGDAVYDVVEALAPNRVRHDSAPDVALLELAVTALDLACPPGAEPLEYEGLREQYLPEVRFRGRVEHRNSQYALYAAACMRGGLKPICSATPAGGRPAVAVRDLRRRHLQPGSRRTPREFRASRSPG
jgi:hypothetical protein